MKAPAVAYIRPSSVEEAVGVLAEHGDDAKVLAGGQSLIPMLNLRLSAPAMLVDVGGIPVLRGATGGQAPAWYGATVTHARVEDLLVPDPSGGLLPHVAEGIGYRAVRTRGTVTGSLVHGDPSAEWPTVMSALDATIRVHSSRGERRVAVRELYLGHFTTVLAPDELATGVEIPRLASGTAWGVHKHNRKVGEFAESLAVVLIPRGHDGAPTGASVWLGAAGDVPLAVPGFDDLIREGSPPALDDIHDRVRAVLPESTVPQERYRAHLHGISIRRSFVSALDQELDA